MSADSVSTVGDREQAVRALQKSLDFYLKTVESIPECACGTKLNEGSWTILELAEHVAVVEHGLLRAIELGSEKSTPTDYAFDQLVIARSKSREVKRMAPERAHPKGRWKSLAECIEAFRQNRARTIELAETDERLRTKEVQHPLFGPIDAHQCLLIMAGHAERHALQMEEIKASEKYQAAVSD